MRCFFCFAVVVSLVFGSSECHGQFSITRIADTNTAIPGQGFNFEGFGGVSIDGDNVSFAGRGNGDAFQGVYVGQGAALGTIVDTSTTIPGSADTFSGFINTWAEGGDYAIHALDASSEGGIYRVTAGTLSTVADSGTNYPGGFGNFGFFDSVSMSETGMIGFEGGSNFSNTGVYSHSGATITEVANQSTIIPGGTGSFDGFSSIRADGNSIGFLGTGSSGQTGIYNNSSGTLEAIVDTNDSVPDSPENFAFFQNPSFDDGQTVFLGAGVSTGGIYISEDGILTTVADIATTIPGTSETFQTLGLPEIEDGNVAFFGGGATTPNSLFFQQSGGDLQLVVSEGEMLDGRTIQLLLTAADPIDGNSLAFHTIFTDGSRGVYRVDFSTAVPEPATSAVLFGSLALLFRRRKQG